MNTREKRNAKKTKERKREEKIIYICGAILTGILGTFAFKTMVAMATPENSEVEAAAEALKEKQNSEKEEIPPEKSEPGIERERNTFLIAIDPGHGGEDCGCIEGGIIEKDINLQIAFRVKEKLEEKGFQVMMPRQNDEYLAKEERVELANSYQADAYVSIHQNTYEGSDKSVSGIETWYDGLDEMRDNKRLAQLIHQETVKSTGAQERTLWGEAQFCVTGKTLMPACLIETGFLSNPQERELLATEEYQEKVAEGIAEGINLYFHPKSMYLTFDDGPSKENTDKVLDVLKEKNIKATFFLIGEYVEKYPEVARRIAQEGHTIGIHCYRHDYQVLYESVNSYLEDFWKAYDVILATTGVKAELVRFPGGSVNAYNKDTCKDIAEELTKQGFVFFDWNASLDDAVGEKEPEQLLINARFTTLDRKKVVMLLHDRVTNTALCLNDLIDQFPEYRMKTLNTKMEPVQFPMP